MMAIWKIENQWFQRKVGCLSKYFMDEKEHNELQYDELWKTIKLAFRLKKLDIWSLFEL